MPSWVTPLHGGKAELHWDKPEPFHFCLQVVHSHKHTSPCPSKSFIHLTPVSPNPLLVMFLPFTLQIPLSFYVPFNFHACMYQLSTPRYIAPLCYTMTINRLHTLDTIAYPQPLRLRYCPPPQIVWSHYSLQAFHFCLWVDQSLTHNPMVPISILFSPCPSTASIPLIPKPPAPLIIFLLPPIAWLHLIPLHFCL